MPCLSLSPLDNLQAGWMLDAPTPFAPSTGSYETPEARPREPRPREPRRGLHDTRVPVRVERTTSQRGDR